MPALRHPVRQRRLLWISIVAVVLLTAAAIFDWSRAPQQQRSVRLYEATIVRPYQRLVRPMLPKVVRCRLHPSCSQYSIEAVRFHGLPRGLWLTTKRILRCNPWAKLGQYDPIPPVPQS